MKKFILAIFAFVLCVNSAYAAVDATKSVGLKQESKKEDKVKNEEKKETVSELYLGIKKYKEKNYVGCIQDMQDLVKKDPANALAYYYMAISYATIGKKEEAINAYRKVSTLSFKDKTLAEYAEKGEKCLINPQGCAASDEAMDKIETELDKFIKYGSSFSDDVNNKLEEMKLRQLKDSINSDANKKTEMPTNDEIAEAVKTLAKVGVNPMQMTGYQTPYTSMQAMYQNPEYMQLQMLMGNDRTNNGNMINMLPYFMSQGKDSANKNISADMIKNMMMSSMIGDLSTTFDMDKDR